MKAALSIFQNRVAPVFDTAREICLIEDSADSGPVRTFCRFDDDDLAGKVRWLVGQGVETLVCGAISRQWQLALVDAGIRVVPFVCGELDEVAHALTTGTLTHSAFAMPGCCGRRRGCGGGGGPGRSRGRGRSRDLPVPVRPRGGRPGKKFEHQSDSMLDHS